MPEAHEEMERAEHAAHGGGRHEAASPHVGVTMAILGALIAFCAATVGSERNELTRAMIEQTQAHADYAAASTKFRLAMLELEKQRGSLAGGSATDTKVVRRFVELATHYSMERKIFGKALDAYRPLVDARFEAGESYERAQLLAEFGIVLASLAVLLGSRAAWLGSVALALCCMVQLALSAIHTKHTVARSLDHLRDNE